MHICVPNTLLCTLPDRSGLQPGDSDSSSSQLLPFRPVELSSVAAAVAAMASDQHSCQKGTCDMGTGGKTIWAVGAFVFSFRRLIETGK